MGPAILVQTPRGTRDFGPQEMHRRRIVEAQLRQVFASFGFKEIQTPTFEELELFTAKSGAGIIDELYAFKDKGGRDLALRPEITAAVMRFYFTSLKMEPKPLKLYYFSNCFRYDRPQAGRYREFWQMGCELIGDPSPVGQAELIALAVQLVDAAGLKNYILRLGHLDVLRAVLDASGLSKEGRKELMRLIDKRDVKGFTAALPDAADRDRLVRLFETQDLEGLRELADGAGCDEAVESVAVLLGRLERLGVDPKRVRLDPSIARGLDYYSGVVFELDAPKLGAEKQLLGGGAYDLSDVFGEPSVASLGFALGFDRLLVALEAEGAALAEAPGPDVHVAALTEASMDAALEAAARLRRAGARVELESTARAPKKALQRASQVAAAQSLLIGDRERESGQFTLKDLSTGQQRSLTLEQLEDQWRPRVAAGSQARPPTG
jgi:histidyl-tRNA synthetase